MRRIITGTLTICCVFSIACFVYAQGIPDAISMLMSSQQQRRCGLHKLTPSEKANLNSFLLRVIWSQSSDLGDNAVAYLANEGGKEVEVIGTRGMEDGEEYLIVYCSLWTYILEPKTYSSLESGKYLGQMSYTSCEIINHLTFPTLTPPFSRELSEYT